MNYDFNQMFFSEM